MINLKFSIIIPVYNTEKYLNKCFDSLINQNYQNFEVIIINDGSTDNSLEICNKYSNNDNRFKIIDIKNQGVSTARNIGLNEVTGDYITFLDSDDWLENDALLVINKKINNKKYDIVQSNLFLDTIKTERLYFNLDKDLEVKNKEEILENIISMNYGSKKFDNKYLNCRCAGGKFYKTELIKNNKISFPIGIKAFEDGIFNLYAYNFAKEILIMKDSVYHYMQYNNSSTEKYCVDQENQNFNILNKIKEFIKLSNYNLDESYNYCIFELYYVWIDKIVRLNDKLNKKQKLNKINEISNISMYKNAINKIELKNLSKIYQKIYTFSKKKKYHSIYTIFTIKKIIKKCR